MLSKYSVTVLPSASDDIDLIAEWYQKQNVELAIKFITEIEFSISKITNSPQAYTAYRNHLSIRRFAMNVFPYLIFYHLTSFHIEIIAVIHTSRSSRYIKRRLK